MPPLAVHYGGIKVSQDDEEVVLPNALILDFGDDTEALEVAVNSGAVKFDLPPEDETVAVALFKEKDPS